ncbi:hypothetical protein GQX73_g3014 [Xylaria multiplex]|uniref:REJ domain-containing protein n=1 Tax=Xylaria multiplex TaxID=323545 RepID=A0A7C8N7X3_9PEZI|nr:hypothetical protein GQX73_g3014 [Xylaria multiplex]
MAMKRVAILALAGTAFAQVTGTSGDTSGSSVPDSTASADESSIVIITATSTSLVGITPPPTTTDATSSVPTSTNASDAGDSSTSVDSSPSETITPTVNSSDTASSPLATDTTGDSTVTITDSLTTTTTGVVGTGGSNANPSGSATGSPISGNAVVNGVSVGFFLISAALTALLQM